MRSPAECWLWRGARSAGGYGAFWCERKIVTAHRVAFCSHWGLFLRMLPKWLCVLHECDTPACVNPAHLWVGTQLDNARDRDKKGRTNSARGDRSGSRKHPERRPRGDRHGCAKLSTWQTIGVMARYVQGVPRSQVAHEYGVSRRTVWSVTAGETWTHLFYPDRLAQTDHNGKKTTSG